jgi:hypothetical protein
MEVFAIYTQVKQQKTYHYSILNQGKFFNLSKFYRGESDLVFG